jgi:hypothetical protein
MGKWRYHDLERQPRARPGDRGNSKETRFNSRETILRKCSSGERLALAIFLLVVAFGVSYICALLYARHSQSRAINGAFDNMLSTINRKMDRYNGMLEKRTKIYDDLNVSLKALQRILDKRLVRKKCLSRSSPTTSISS